MTYTYLARRAHNGEGQMEMDYDKFMEDVEYVIFNDTTPDGIFLKNVSTNDGILQ